MFYVSFVCIAQIDTSAEEEGKGRCAIIPRDYNWPSQGGSFIAVSFVLCSVLFKFQMFSFYASVCPVI